MCLFTMLDRPTVKRRRKGTMLSMSHTSYVPRNQPSPYQYRPITRGGFRNVAPNTARMPRRVKKRSLLRETEPITPQPSARYRPVHAGNNNSRHSATSRHWDSLEKASPVRKLTSQLLQRQTLSTRQEVLDSLLPKYQCPPRDSYKRPRGSTIASLSSSSSPSSLSSSSSGYDRGGFSPRRRASTISSPPSSISSWGNNIPLVQPPVLPLFAQYVPTPQTSSTYSTSYRSSPTQSMRSSQVSPLTGGSRRYYAPSSRLGSRYQDLFSWGNQDPFASSASGVMRRERMGDRNARYAALEAIRETQDATAREIGRLDSEMQRVRQPSMRRGLEYGLWAWD